MISLRPFQAHAVQRLREAFRDLAKRALLLVSPTGSGKTYMFCAITQGASQLGNRTLILQHRKELIRQASLSLARLGVRHAIIAPPKTVESIRRRHLKALGKSFIDDEALVAVGSVQTVIRRLEWLQAWAPVLLVLDEAHHAMAETWSRICAAVPDARVLGVTATPIRLDGAGLGGLFVEMIEAATVPELIDLGLLLRVRCWQPPCRADLSRVHLVGGDLALDEAAALLNRPTITGDAVDHYRTLCPGARALVYCCNVAHATSVCEAFNAAGFNFALVLGSTDADERDARIEGLELGTLDGIVSVDVLTEGLDVPAAEVCIMLRPTESEEKFLQMVGRVMRIAPGKAFGRLHDHVNNLAKFGSPNGLRPWSLDGRKRRKRGELAEPSLRVLQCPACYFCGPEREVCGGMLADGSACRHVFVAKVRTPSHRDGVLEEVRDDLVAPRHVAPTGRARSYQDLLRAGCSHGRARHILEARAAKQALEDRIRELVAGLQEAAPHLHTRELIGCTLSDLASLKPAKLRKLAEYLEAFDVDEALTFRLEG